MASLCPKREFRRIAAYRVGAFCLIVAAGACGGYAADLLHTLRWGSYISHGPGRAVAAAYVLAQVILIAFSVMLSPRWRLPSRLLCYTLAMGAWYGANDWLGLASPGPWGDRLFGLVGLLLVWLVSLRVRSPRAS